MCFLCLPSPPRLVFPGTPCRALHAHVCVQLHKPPWSTPLAPSRLDRVRVCVCACVVCSCASGWCWTLAVLHCSLAHRRMQLSDRGLLDHANRFVPCTSEADVFRALDLPYQDPHERSLCPLLPRWLPRGGPRAEGTAETEGGAAQASCTPADPHPDAGSDMYNGGYSGGSGRGPNTNTSSQSPSRGRGAGGWGGGWSRRGRGRRSGAHASGSGSTPGVAPGEDGYTTE